MIGIYEPGHTRRRRWDWRAALGGWVPRLVPQVLSGAVLLTGTILLISGATPGVPGRLAWLGDILPLGLIELSHFIGSLAGVGLLMLAWALWHRLDAAYGFTLALLAVGIGASLLKGVDWEEARVLAVVLCAVLPARRYFYRKSAIGTRAAGARLAAGDPGGGRRVGLARRVRPQARAVHRRALVALRASRPTRRASSAPPWASLARCVAVGLMRLFRHAPAEVELPRPRRHSTGPRRSSTSRRDASAQPRAARRQGAPLQRRRRRPS